MTEQPNKFPLLLDAKQACEYLGLSMRTLYELRSKKVLPAPVQLGERIVRYRRDDLEAFVSGLEASYLIKEPSQLAIGKRSRRGSE